MTDKFWGLGEKTPNRKYLSEGDKVVYYIGWPDKYFGGTATLASASFALNPSQINQFSHGKKYYTTDYGVLLKDVDIWPKRKPVEDVLPQLEFIENKEFWGAYLQGGVRQIKEEDYKLITGEKTLVEQIKSSSDIESQHEFALEMHLEEFIYKNWENVNWGANLNLYKNDEQDGRQFPAGIWSIDLLAEDKVKNELVVIELKKGKASDVVVGQLSRYIGWIKENVAAKNQSVRGIIIAHEIDESLKYAVKGLPHIEVKTYKVNFTLS
jgi:hypothetical protein